ncbi:hypothetical protein T05_12381 [Trichinella murrelli]|uniref:Uncharacterized protein n=1 Tax=Trichinella murrelli TaxID=144512 RepID=A0A0V0TMW5_9BILA|nr:hypothetical protein T05_12381 [Trichinella murrelli]
MSAPLCPPERVRTLLAHRYRSQVPPLRTIDTSRGLAVIQANPMPQRVAGAGSWMIRTLEPSVMVIFPACQSISLTYWSRKFEPRIPGTTKLSTTATCMRPLQLTTCSGNVPWPQRRTLRPSLCRMEPPAASKGSPPKQPPRCPKGGKSPARLAYLRQTAHVQLEVPSSPGDAIPISVIRGSSSSAVALGWLLFARAVSSSIRHLRGSFPRVSGLLRGGFDPLPQRTISDRRALGSMTERHAVQQWLLHRIPSELHF